MHSKTGYSYFKKNNWRYDATRVVFIDSLIGTKVANLLEKLIFIQFYFIVMNVK